MAGIPSGSSAPDVVVKQTLTSKLPGVIPVIVMNLSAPDRLWTVDRTSEQRLKLCTHRQGPDNS